MQSPYETYVAFGAQQQPAKASCKARWVEAEALKPGDVILWQNGTLQQPVPAEAVRFGWWNRVYVQSGGNPTALVIEGAECVKIADRD